MRIHANGVELNVLIEGEGPDVLLIHGYPDDHTVWRKQIPALVAAGYRVIAPDTRGNGESSAATPYPQGYRISNYVDDMIAILDAVGSKKVRVVGHDWGAHPGWHLCMYHSERIDRYVAVSVGHPNALSGAGIEQKLKSWYMLAFQARGVAEWSMSAFNWKLFRQVTGYPTECDRWIPRLSQPGRLTASLGIYRANLKLFVTHNFPASHVPAMGIWSSGDRFVKEKQMLDSARYMEARWRYERIDGANHWVQLDASEHFNALLLDYFAISL